MTKDEALAMDLALEALEYIENNYMSLPKSGSEAITAIKQARSAPVQEPVAFNAGVPPLYPEMKDGETISVEYTNPPAAQKDIQRLSALVRAQQITIDKLEQARSAPVQEPVAWVRLEAWKSGAEWPDDCFTDAHADGLVPLYTTPPAAQLAPMQEPVGWVNHANIASAVVERERGGSGDTHTWSESKTAYHTVPFYTTPQPQQAEKQEPVAWIDGGDLELMRKHGRGCIAWGTQQNNANTPLYTTPPAAAQQQWTGLTDEEIEKGRDQTFSINNPYCPCNSKTMRKAVRWAEAKLKEKNNG